RPADSPSERPKADSEPAPVPAPAAAPASGALGGRFAEKIADAQNSSQAYFHVSREKQVPLLRQQLPPAQANSQALNTLNLPTGNFTRMVNLGNNLDHADSKAMIRMLIVVKKDAPPTSAPSPQQ